MEDYIKIEVLDHLLGEHSPRIYEGTWESVENALRHDFPSYVHGIEQGNLREVLRELDRAHGIELGLLAGEVPPHQPHLHPVLVSVKDPDDSWRQ